MRVTAKSLSESNWNTVIGVINRLFLIKLAHIIMSFIWVIDRNWSYFDISKVDNLLNQA